MQAGSTPLQRPEKMELVNMQPVQKPFSLDIDVTGDTPLNEIPESYGANVKARIIAESKFAADVQKGIEELSVNPEVETAILNEIHLSVSSLDDPIIKTVLHAGVSAFASPLNISLKAESGSGKSYSTLETIKYLPQENVMHVGSDSPKVFSHLNGVKKCLSENGVELLFDEVPEPQKPDKKDYDLLDDYKRDFSKYSEDLKAYNALKESSWYEIDLRNKIIVYLESINPELFKMLKATMSHDAECVIHRYVDEQGKTREVHLLGAPVLIFNSLDAYFMAEFATRTLTISPVTTPEKFEASMNISNRKSCYPWLYASDTLQRTAIKEYFRRIRDAMKEGRIKTINPFDGVAELFSKSQTRDMRDFNKFLELLPTYAITKLFQRPIIILGNQRFLVPTVDDFYSAKAVFDSVAETTKTGTEQRIISFYWDCVAKHPGTGVTVETLTDEYNANRKKPVSSRRIREWLDRLEEIEFLDARVGEQLTAKGDIDRQKITYHPLKLKGTNAVLDFAIDLKPILEKAFDSWLKNVAAEVVSHPIMILNIDGTAKQLNLEEFCAVVKGGSYLTPQRFLKLNQSQNSKPNP